MDKSTEVEFILKMRDEATRILKQNGQEWEETGKKSEGAAKGMNNAAKAAKAAAVALGALYVANRSIVGTLGVFRQYQTGMLEVQKTTGMSAKVMRGFSKEFDAFAANASTSISSIQGIAGVSGQLGMTSSKDILKFSQTVSKMGVATDLAGAEGATTLARMLNVFNESPQSVGRLADVLVRLGNTSAATEAQIARVAQQVALQTSTYEIGTTAASAIGAAMAELGLNAELSGTSVGRVFKTIESAVITGGEELEIFADLAGTSREAFAQMFKDDPMKAFLAFQQGLGRVINEGGNYLAVLEDLGLNQAEITKTITPLAKNYDRLAEKMKNASEAAAVGGDLNAEYEVFAKSLDAALQRLSNSVDILQKNLGGELAPAVTSVIDGLTSMVQAANDAYTALDDMGTTGDVLQTMIASAAIAGPSLVALGASVKALNFALSAMGVQALAGAAGMGVLRAGATALAGSFGIAGAAIAGFMYLDGRYRASTAKAEQATEHNKVAVDELRSAYARLGQEGGPTITMLKEMGKAQLDAAASALAAAEAQLAKAKADFEDYSWAEFFTFDGNMDDLRRLEEAQKHVDALREAQERLKKANEDAAREQYSQSRRDAYRQKKDLEEMGGSVFIDTAAMKSKIRELFPEVSEIKDAAKAYEEFKKLLEATDEQLAELNLTREQAKAIVEQARIALTQEVSVVESSIRASKQQLEVLKLDRNEREAAKQVMDLENEARRQGIDLLDAETQSRLEVAKALIRQVEAANRRQDFVDTIREETDQLRMQAAIYGLHSSEQERAAAIAEKRFQAEKAGIKDVEQYINEYATAWDQAHAARKRAEFMENQESALQGLAQQVELIGFYGEARERQAQLIQVALEAEKAGIQNVTPILEHYVQLWNKLDEAQKGAAGAINGTRSAFQSFIEEGQNMAANFEQLTTTMLDGFVDNTVDALMTGEANFEQFFKNIASMALKMALKSILADIFERAGLGGQKASVGGAIASAAGVKAFQLGSSPANPVWVKSVDNLLPGMSPAGAASLTGSGGFLSPLGGSGALEPFAAAPTGLVTRAPLPSVEELASMTVQQAGKAAAQAAAQTGKAVTKKMPDVIEDVLKSGPRSGIGSYKEVGNFAARGADKVDAQLRAIMKETAERYGYNVEAFSGYRPGDSRLHGSGKALDVRLLDQAGKYIGGPKGHYQTIEGFRQYEKFAQHARMVQQEMFPELDDKFRWGGYFSGGKGKYGALDGMHFDTGGRPGLGMGGGSWEHGLTDAQRRLWPGIESRGMLQAPPSPPLTDMSSGLDQLNTSMSTVNTHVSQMGYGMQNLGQNMGNAIPNLDQLQTGLQQAVPQIGEMGQRAQTVLPQLSSFGQGVGGLQNPLQAVIPGLGGFQNGIMSLMQSLQGMGGGGFGGIGGLFSGLFSGFGGFGGMPIGLFAEGGVMTPQGPRKLKRYSSGGVSKEAAIFGEAGPEAAVPLPDGRRIPVKLEGSLAGSSAPVNMMSQSKNVFAPSITINSEGSRSPEDDEALAKDLEARLEEMFERKYAESTLGNMRGGGLMSGVGGNRGGYY